MKTVLLYLMAFAYILAGINHFWHPVMYLKIIPHVLPMHNTINVVSGIAEIILGILLIPKATRNMAAWGLVVLLVVILPANIQMAVDYTKEDHPQKLLSYIRLPIQILLVWWALFYTDWYNRKRETSYSK